MFDPIVKLAEILKFLEISYVHELPYVSDLTDIGEPGSTETSQPTSQSG